jgi:hypothetical protein
LNDASLEHFKALNHYALPQAPLGKPRKQAIEWQILLNYEYPKKRNDWTPAADANSSKVVR